MHRRNPFISISLGWCILCKNDGETANHSSTALSLNRFGLYCRRSLGSYGTPLGVVLNILRSQLLSSDIAGREISYTVTAEDIRRELGIITIGEEKVELSKIKKKCEKCGHDEASYYTRQVSKGRSPKRVSRCSGFGFSSETLMTPYFGREMGFADAFSCKLLVVDTLCICAQESMRPLWMGLLNIMLLGRGLYVAWRLKAVEWLWSSLWFGGGWELWCYVGVLILVCLVGFRVSWGGGSIGHEALPFSRGSGWKLWLDPFSVSSQIA
ncbi:hypothetical protein L484_016008 [Morus notabilis]|uniref:Uncharacterized protein n=1 Tax=Morus notabilis TaxID=981085 RepID=W9R7E3_9ROSA|nr:hypothetical protein L484_016008 [Morus notabilis]